MIASGSLLKVIRKEWKKTQKDMSLYLSCTLRCYQMYESGQLVFPAYRQSLLDFLLEKWTKEKDGCQK